MAHTWIEKADLENELSDWAKTNLEFDVVAGQEGEPPANVTIADKAINKAEIFIITNLISFGKYPTYPELWTDTLKLCAKKLAVYELYARVEQEEKAKDKREDAIAMLKALLEGGVVSGGGEEEAATDKIYPPSMYVVPGSTDWKGFKE